MSSEMKRGALLIFEGLDKSGKSTQAKLLVKSLKEIGKEAELISFPDRTTLIGKTITEFLTDKKYDLHGKAVHLLFTANRFENLNNIMELLMSGINVIIDRYSYSGIVYSAAKKVEGMDAFWCKSTESGLPEPDCIYFLKVPLDEIKRRPGFGEERYENIAFQARVLMEYEKLSKECSFTNIDGKDSIEVIQNKILQHSLKTIENVENSDLKYLNFKNII